MALLVKHGCTDQAFWIHLISIQELPLANICLHYTTDDCYALPMHNSRPSPWWSITSSDLPTFLLKEFHQFVRILVSHGCIHFYDYTAAIYHRLHRTRISISLFFTTCSYGSARDHMMRFAYHARIGGSAPSASSLFRWSRDMFKCSHAHDFCAAYCIEDV